MDNLKTKTFTNIHQLLRLQIDLISRPNYDHKKSQCVTTIDDYFF